MTVCVYALRDFPNGRWATYVAKDPLPTNSEVFWRVIDTMVWGDLYRDVEHEPWKMHPGDIGECP